MSKQSVKATIDANIKQNGNQEITGNILNSVLNDMVDETIERVELECDDTKITLKDSSTALTYAQIKALVDDAKKFVTLRYLDMWWMLPSYDDGGAIMFTSADIEGQHPVVTRVIINSDGQLNNYSIRAEEADHKTDDMSIETAADGDPTYPTTRAVNIKIAEVGVGGFIDVNEGGVYFVDEEGYIGFGLDLEGKVIGGVNYRIVG